MRAESRCAAARTWPTSDPRFRSRRSLCQLFRAHAHPGDRRFKVTSLWKPPAQRRWIAFCTTARRWVRLCIAPRSKSISNFQSNETQGCLDIYRSRVHPFARVRAHSDWVCAVYQLVQTAAHSEQGELRRLRQLQLFGSRAGVLERNVELIS